MSAPAPTPAEEPPGLPFARTWSGLYILVAVSFIAMVAALLLFSRAYA